MEDEAEPTNFMLVARNLSDKVNNQMLRELFAPYNVVRCRVVYRNNRSKGWAGIEFNNVNDATRAKEALEGTKLDGRVLQILDAQQSDREWFMKKKPNTRPKAGMRTGFDVPPPGPFGRGGMETPPAGQYGWGAGRGAPPPAFGRGRWGPQPTELGQRGPNETPFSTPPGPPRDMFPPSRQPQEFQPFAQPFTPLRPALHSPQHAIHPYSMPAEYGVLHGVMDVEDKPTEFSAFRDLKNQKFHIIDFQYSWEVQGTGIPTEIAIVTLTFSEGEKSVFHRFINPGPIPICYVPNAIWQTKTVHGIPHHNFQHAEKNYSKLWNELLYYLDPEKVGLPTLYAKAPFAKTSSISWLAQKAGQPNPFRPVHSIEEILDHFHSISTISMHSSAIQDYFGVGTTALRGKCEFHDMVTQGLSDTGGPNTAQCALANARFGCDVIKSSFERLRIEERLGRS